MDNFSVYSNNQLLDLELACNKLLHSYSSVGDSECPLCDFDNRARISTGTDMCDVCPWTTIAESNCGAYFHSFTNYKFSECIEVNLATVRQNPSLCQEWTLHRIKMLQEWLALISEEIETRKSNRKLLTANF
jgi:ribosomal protein L37AE/L43A